MVRDAAFRFLQAPGRLRGDGKTYGGVWWIGGAAARWGIFDWVPDGARQDANLLSDPLNAVIQRLCGVRVARSALLELICVGETAFFSM